MRRLNRFTALALGLLLFAAPAAWACGQLTAMMACCPDAEPVDMSMCHGTSQASIDCCTMESAPEPRQASELRTSNLITVLEASDLESGTPTTSAASRADTAPAQSSLLHELGRYTLFSSFLL
jgi:hypothetical protein